MNVTGIWRTTRDVTAIVVSRDFYARVMPYVPWLRRSLNWGHFARPKNGTVQILFRHDYLGQRAEEVRRAIETRWRAFSRHPNAKLPPDSEPMRSRRSRRLLTWLHDWALPAILILSLPAAYLYIAFIRVPELAEGVRSWYLGDLLDKGIVPARLADGRMANLSRWDISAAGIPRCENTGYGPYPWLPLHVMEASCAATLDLPSGETALAVFRITTETIVVEYALGKFRENRFLVAVPPDLQEADALLCKLGHCGRGAQN